MSGREVAWTADEVLEQLARTGKYATDVARSLLAWERRQPFIQMTGGTGTSNGTLRIAADTGQGSSLRILLLYADPVDGHPLLEIHVKNMRSVPPYNHREAADRLVADLGGLGIPRLQAADIPGGTWPSIPLSELTGGRIERLLSLIDRWIDDVRAHPAHR